MRVLGLLCLLAVAVMLGWRLRCCRGFLRMCAVGILDSSPRAVRFAGEHGGGQYYEVSRAQLLSILAQ